MITQRFNSNPAWNIHYNNSFFGLISVTEYVRDKLGVNRNMIEIGAYMGESTFIFASSRIFYKIHTIEPHLGNDDFNNINNYDWEFVKNEFKTNLRFFNNLETSLLGLSKSPKYIHFVGHTETHAGNCPSFNLWWQNVHLST